MSGPAAPSARPAPRVAWDWPAFARGAVLGAPAGAAAAADVQLGAVLAVGLIPAVTLPLPPRRRDRTRVAVVGALAGVSLVLGGILALWAPAAVAGIFLIAVTAARIAAARPRLSLILYLCLPVTAVGFSYPGVSKAAALGAVMMAGSLWAVLVGLAWPAAPAPATPTAQVPTATGGDLHLVAFGYRAGLAGAVCAAIGFAADLEHVGWAPAAALLVMRPSPHVHWTRSWNRIVDVILGAAVAVAVVAAEVPDIVVAVLVLAAVMTATAVASSRYYLLPLFSTFFVFLMLLSDDPGAARDRFWERVTETLVGVAVAALFGILVPAVGARLVRRRARADRPSTTGAPR